MGFWVCGSSNFCPSKTNGSVPCFGFLNTCRKYSSVPLGTEEREAKKSNREEKEKFEKIFSNFEKRKRKGFHFSRFERRKRNFLNDSPLSRRERERDFIFSRFERRTRNSKYKFCKYEINFRSGKFR